MSEKLLFTRNRVRTWANKLHDISVTDIESQWGKYCLTPLDIPNVNVDGIAEWFFDRKKPVVKRVADIAGGQPGQGDYNSVDINLSSIPLSYWTRNEEHNFLEEFPYFVDQLMDLFPFKKIHMFRFWESVKPIGLHRDDNDFRDFPNNFRTMVYDENPDSTLFSEEWLPDATVATGPRKFIPRLPETNSWAWNNLRTRHGSTYNPNYKKILLIVSGFEIDGNKYNKTMQRSINKYSEYIMTSERDKTDYIIPISDHALIKLEKLQRKNNGSK